MEYKQICPFCKSDEIRYWDNVEMCTSFEWGWYCADCGEYINDDEIIIKECEL